MAITRIQDSEQVKQTILHEIAHCFAFEIYQHRGHGFKWKQIARHIGYTGERTSLVEDKKLPKSKYTLKCNYCDHIGRMYKKPKRSRSCPNCHPGSYNANYKLEVIQNW